jgi:hypothetical protein
MPAVPIGLPGNRVEGDDLAPVFRLEINDAPLNYDINRLVTGIEFETALDMADMLKLTIDNPGLIDEQFPDWTGHRAFQPGNEVSVYMGYGRADRPENFLGRVIWAKHLPNFPQEGMPQLTVTGYDIRFKMMDNEGPVVSAGKNTTPATKRPVELADDQGQVFESILHSEIVQRIADMYEMLTDIDPTTRRDHLIIKKGKKHYELIKGLANLNNKDFWIDWSLQRRRWVLHWKDKNRNQDAQYILRYAADTDPNNLLKANTNGTLLSFEPDYGLREQVSTATILIFDGKNQRWVSAIEIEDASGPDPIYRPGGGVSTRAAVATRAKPKKPGAAPAGPKTEARATTLKRQAKDVIGEALDNATAFRIAAGGVAIDVLPPGVRFRDPEEAGQFLFRWFQSKQDNFISGKGRTVGIETLRSHQVHTLRGIGERLSGNYYFTRVSHQQQGESYACEFNANKVIT